MRSAPSSTTWLSCAIAGLLMISGSTDAQTLQSDPAIDATIATANSFVDGRLREVSAQLLSGEDLLKKLTASAQGEPKKEGEGRTVGGTFTRTFEKDKPKPASPPSQALDAAKFQLEAAASSYQKAEDLYWQAKQQDASDPKFAMHLRKLAVDKVNETAGWIEKAGNTVKSTGSGAPAPSIPRASPLAGACDHLACRQLKAIAGTDRPGVDGPQLNLFDSNRRFPVAVREPPALTPPPDRILKGTFAPTLQREGAREFLSLGPQTRIDLAQLKRAVATVDPAVARQPLFVSIGPGGTAAPTRELQRLVASPQQREQLRKVGGVTLEATFDLLSAAGMPEFRGGMNITLLEDPVLLSLKKLHAAVVPFAQSGRWNTLPESLRFPGHLERLHGFVLDPESNDIVLLGRPASHPSRRLDIDMIVLALRQMWRDGKTMAVSLDPLPNDFGGPQYPRVIDVPLDSIVARTMLDADYAMKVIVHEGRFADSETFLDVDAALGPNPQSYLSRFWLSPRPLERTAIHLSKSGRSALFETNVDVLTEELFIANGQIAGAGHSASIPERLAAAFNTAYTAIEASPAVKPSGVFVRLHGLMDVATFAKIWRGTGISYDILSRFAALPYRVLSGRETVPRFYQGLVTERRLAGGSIAISRAGGVELTLRQGAEPARTYADRITLALEQAVRAMRSSKDFVQRASLIVALPAREAATTTDFEAALFGGQQAFERGDFALATRNFQDAIAEDPLSPHGYTGLARVYVDSGRYRAAAREVARALMLAPNDDFVRLLGMDVIWRHDQRALLEKHDDWTKRELSRYYYTRALHAYRRGRSEESARFVEWSMEIWEDNGDAHLLRSALYSRRDDRRAMVQIARAIRAFRRQAKEAATDVKQPLALALSVSASRRIGRVATASVRETLADVGDLEKARDEAREAVALDPGLPLGHALEALAGSLLTMISTKDGVVPDLHPYLVEADRAVVRFADHPTVYAIRAQIRFLSSDRAGALSDLDKAVILAPSQGELYALRAIVRVGLNQCSHARRDLVKARELSPEEGTVAPADIDAVANCIGQ